MAELKALSVKRSSLKGQVTNIKKTIDKIIAQKSRTKVDIAEIEVKLEALREHHKTYSNIQDKIEALIDESVIDEQRDRRNAFDDFVMALAAKAKVTLADYYGGGTGGANNGPTVNANIHLPSINLPAFDGSSRQWLEFSDIFKSLIHDNAKISNTEKFYYLKTALKGEAAGVISSIGISAQNYISAWDTLSDRYNNSSVIVDSHVRSLFELNSIVKESSSAMRNLIDTISKHLRCLETLKEPVQHWDTLIIHIVSSKLDTASRRGWEMKRKELATKPTFKNLTEYMQERWEVLEALHSDKPDKINNQNNYNKASKHVTVAHYTTPYAKCPICNDTSHLIYKCNQFLSWPVLKRFEEIKKRRLCYNCLNAHHTKACKSKFRCFQCGNRHNTLIHLPMQRTHTNTSSGSDEVMRSETYQQSTADTSDGSGSGQTVCHYSSKLNKETLLSTLIAEIKGKTGRCFDCRILLDCGSQSSYITTEFCKKLNLNLQPTNIAVKCINDATTNIRHQASAAIMSKIKDFSVCTNFLVIDKITEELPLADFDKSQLNIPSHITLADSNFNIRGKIDVLLGADVFWIVLGRDLITLNEAGLALKETHFGWVVGGSNYTREKPSISKFTGVCRLESLVRSFWEIEQFSNQMPWTEEQRAAEASFASSVRHLPSGRFVVKIPLKPDVVLGSSRHNAEKRFYSLERRFKYDNQLKSNYCEFIQEYIDLGHMTLVDERQAKKLVYYVPHHAIVKENSLTTKLRVVFDASCKTNNGNSLNDLQLVGPTIQSDIISILLRFRIHKYILAGDISKMYRQIMIDETQTSLQRILWRPDENEELRCYELMTVTYGTASAPYLAIRCMKQLAIENRDKFPVECEIIERDTYVDDVLTGDDDLSNLKRLKRNITDIFNSAGFKLRKFVSNEPSLLEETSDDEQVDPFLNITSDQTKTLGIRWDVKMDNIYYEMKEINALNIWTKRKILSEVAKLYDPLGLLAPIIIVAKLIIQKLWETQTKWDDPVHESIHVRWTSLVAGLTDLCQLRIPRHTMSAGAETYELHGFADASESAFGACVYIRSINNNNETFNVHLLTSKSRVAPLKQVSLPRLELSAAVLLAKLVQKILESIPIKFKNQYLWSDSTVTLCWIASPCTKWKTFVANRVSEIQSITNINDWHHVRSEDNPADIISRGTSVQNLITSQLWWHGPHWLSLDNMAWPPRLQLHNNDNIPEIKNIALHTRQTSKNSSPLFTRYSNYNTFLSTLAIALRFIRNSRQRDKLKRNSGPITVSERKLTLMKLLLLCQQESFGEELVRLKSKKQLHVTSKLLQLSPFLDTDGLIRVGGRLRNASLPFSKKHPIVLDSNHSFTKLIVEHEHVRTLHSGPESLLNSIRGTYWPISGRNLCRQVVRKCIVCFRVKPKSTQPIMGDLPIARVTPAPPFTNTGTDFAGPILIIDRKGRGGKTIKAYLCLFVCLAVKAYHIEVVSDMTTEGFLAAFKRFIARRGRPDNIYSDNGKNYVGANTDMKKMFKYFNSESNKTVISNHLKTNNVTWHFIPPRAPNFGGLWESGIKSIKTHLAKIVGNVKLTYEELATVVTQIESILNSRPLTPLTSDPNDFTPLTPAHFLIGRTFTALPEPDLAHLSENRLSRYQLITRLTQHFWSRWYKEYLNVLHNKPKWNRSSGPCINVGDLVIIKDDNLPPLLWKTARVQQLHPGRDNVARVATIVLPNKTVMKRPLNKLCALPID